MYALFDFLIIRPVYLYILPYSSQPSQSIAGPGGLGRAWHVQTSLLPFESSQAKLLVPLGCIADVSLRRLSTSINAGVEILEETETW